MSLSYWFQYSSVAIYPYLQQNAPASGAGLAVIGPYPQDTAPSEVVMAYTYPQRFLVVSGALVEQPYWTLATATSGATVTVTGTLNSPPATVPTSATFTLCGQTYVETVTSGTTTLAFDIHPSVASATFPVSVAASGTVTGTVTLGAQTAPVALQVYTPSGGVPTIAPTGAGSKLLLQGYYASLMPVPQEVADIATLVGMTAHTLFDVVLPALSATVTLDANQQNALNDLRANVMNHVVTTLENAAPVPASGATQTYDPHYANVRADYPTVAQALEGYATDVATIPNLA